MTEHVFTYGSLMFAPVWQRLVPRLVTSSSAHVNGLARFSIVGEPYPGCVFAADACTQGTLYLDLTPREIASLDAFEGEHYARAEVVATDAQGTSYRAWTYRYLLPEKLSTKAWDPTQFEREHMAQFIAQYQPTRL